MIEIKKGESSEEYQLVVDGVIATKDDVRIFKSKDNDFSVDVYDSEFNRKILGHRFSDLPASIWKLEVFIEPDLVETSEIIESINIIHHPPSEPFQISFDFEHQFDKWKYLWSIEEYIREIYDTFGQKDESGLSLPAMDEYTIVEYSFRASVENIENTLEEEISKYAETIRQIHTQAEASLVAKLRNDSVVMFFDFPEEVRVSCEQYLLYFVQFLRDLGVSATAELQHQAGQVLFAVTPEDKEEALDKIRAALETYLRLPASKLTGDDKDIVAQRLAANIYHLKSQLALGQAILQAKDATIETQQLTIDIQRSLLSGEIVLNSLKDTTPKPEDKEDLLGGVVALATYKDKGVEINLAELYRKLKGMFKDKE